MVRCTFGQVVQGLFGDVEVRVPVPKDGHAADVDNAQEALAVLHTLDDRLHSQHIGPEERLFGTGQHCPVLLRTVQY